MNSTERDPPDGLTPVGRVGKAHGLKGAFRLQPHPPDRPALKAGDAVWVEGLGEAEVVSAEVRASFAVIQLDRVRDVDHARMLVHRRVHAAGEEGPANADPAGTPVRLNGQLFGHIVAVVGSDAHPLVEIETERGPVLVPGLAPYVHWRADGLDLHDPPDGLLDS